MAEKIVCPRCKGDVEIWQAYWDEDPESIPMSELNFWVHYQVYICGLCDGTGEIDSHSDRLCSECKGTGEDSQGWSCDECDGKGFNWGGNWEDEFVKDTGDDEPT